jgi:hypothetical protein
MEPTQAKPIRKRRRWLIVAVAFVLVLVSTVSWWNWPRGDARFVGTWAVSSGSANPATRSIRWDIHSNGIGVTTFVNKMSASASYRFVWRVDDNRFVIGRPLPTWMISTLNSLQQRLLKTLRTSFLYTHERYAVKFRSENEIQLQDLDDPTSTLVLTRLPE